MLPVLALAAALNCQRATVENPATGYRAAVMLCNLPVLPRHWHWDLELTGDGFIAGTTTEIIVQAQS